MSPNPNEEGGRGGTKLKLQKVQKESEDYTQITYTVSKDQGKIEGEAAFTRVDT